MNFRAIFYYKDYPAENGTFELEGAHKDEAGLKVSLMVKNRDTAIPGNWDRYEVKAA